MKRLLFLVFGLAMVMSAGIVAAQDRGEPTLTAAQTNSAIRIPNASSLSGRVPVFAGESVTYLVDNCGGAPCYLVVTGSGASNRNDVSFDASNDAEPEGSNPPTVRTVTCGVEIYSTGLPIFLGKLVNNTTLNYHKGWKGHFGLPVTLLSGNTSGTWNTVFTSWTNITGPTPNPGWNIKVKKSAGLASTVVSGTISIVIPVAGLPIGTSLNAAISVGINPNQTFCY